MGDMADFYLDEMMDDDEYQQRLFGLGYDELTDSEREFMYNEDGSMKPLVFDGWNPHRRSRKPRGPGACPKCGANTVERNGPHGKFYGCSKFPECRGNRNP